jgi:hypothetical protein
MLQKLRDPAGRAVGPREEEKELSDDARAQRPQAADALRGSRR